MNAEELFDSYNTMKQRRDTLSYQINHFAGINPDDVISEMSFAHQDNDDVRVQTSNNSDKTARIAANYRKVLEKENDDYYKLLVREYAKLDRDISFIESIIKGLGRKKSDIVFDVLDKALTWDQIADSYHVSRSTVCRYRREAIRELEKQFGLIERMELKYLLS